jgi:hypothetical protein
VRDALKASPDLTVGQLTARASSWNLHQGRKRPITGTTLISERAVREAAKGIKSF